MIDENKEVSHFVVEYSYEVQILDDGTYDEEDEEEVEDDGS